MKVAVIRFPGSNCDQDAYFAVKDDLGLAVDYVWYETTSLAGYDAAIIPGGFSYGDYLRCGAMASLAPVMSEVSRFAQEGRLVAGFCNGFQILCETGLLPGALLLNRDEKFLCQDVYLRAATRRSPWTEGVDKDLRIPIAHGEGRYVATDEELTRLRGEGQIAFEYVAGPDGGDPNPNGSAGAIAGVLNERGNVLGMMPHPERATKSEFGYGDGLQILRALTLISTPR